MVVESLLDDDDDGNNNNKDKDEQGEEGEVRGREIAQMKDEPAGAQVADL